MKSRFLSGEWKKLIMINYKIDPSILIKYLPSGTEIDLWNDTCFISLVGFMFKNTRLKGFAIPFHENFEEVNLRFYVKYRENPYSDYKRGVVFIKENVPKPALTFIANTFFNEHYETLEMKHDWVIRDDRQIIKYHWNSKEWNTILVEALKKPIKIMENSEEEFITEHYWGYTRLDNNFTSEYEVKHPKWDIYEILNYSINVNFESNYGKEFKILEEQQPISDYLAEGSEITVYSPRKIKF